MSINKLLASNKSKAMMESAIEIAKILNGYSLKYDQNWLIEQSQNIVGIRDYYKDVLIKEDNS